MPKFIDLFAGCGGFSAGLRAAGWTAVAEVEVDNWACESLRANFPDSQIIEADIRTIPDDDILALGPVDLIVGGPPCQGFSVAGGAQFGLHDPRNELFRWFLHWVQLLQPKAAVIENVPAILSRLTGGETVLSAIKGVLGPLGYTVDAKVLNSADFGVPQSRRRAFIVMLRDEGSFQFPFPTNAAAAEQKDLFKPLQPYTTVGEALSDLPKITAGEGTDDPVPYGTAAQNAYQKACRGEQGLVANHIAMKHTGRLIERFKVISPGQSLKDVPQCFGQIANHTGESVSKPFKYNNYRLDAGKPSLTIPASFQSLFLHPSFHRNLTAREAARLMGFPDKFVFRGKRTTMSWEKNLSQYNQIGNAVCPPVAASLGQALTKYVNDSSIVTRQKQTSVISIHRESLKRSIQIPIIYSELSPDTLKALRAVSATFGEREETFRFKGYDIPSVALPLALILTQTDGCPLCSPDLTPHARHSGEICFLISKEGNDSLLENEQDHGLDYHLRSALGIENQVAHLVGERLAELGLVRLVSLQNPRTGRSVRGMQVLPTGEIDERLALKTLADLRVCATPEEAHILAAVG